MIASLGDDVYTDVTRWRCSSSYTPGWNATAFDDCGWEAPIIKNNPWTPTTDFNPSASHIWSVAGGWDIYCRTERLPEAPACDIPVNRHHVFYHGITPDGSLSTHKHTTTHTVSDSSICSVMCTEGATSCLQSNGSVCLPPVGGCCGFTYDDQQMSCDLYTVIPPCAFRPIPNLIYVVN